MAAGTRPILMPKLGLTMTEGLIAAWHVAPGQEVREGDVLFVVETEKIATEITAFGPGRITALTCAAGAVVPVGAQVATWTGGADGETPSPVAAEPAPARIVATPLARKIARGAGLDLRGIAGSGPRGRIKAADVEARIAARPAAPAQEPFQDTGTGPESTGLEQAGAWERSGIAPGATRRPATAIERVVAHRLTQAKQAIPHFYVLAEADVTRLTALREELNADPDRPRLSLTPFVVAAVGRALARMPEVNVIWDDDAVVTLPEADVGVAVDTPRGLLAPVVRGADRASLDAIARAVGDLAGRARAGRLAAADLQGGAISVSNVGMFGASHLVPIINPGQSAILGVAAVRPAFRPDAAGAPALVREMGLVLSCDHRVLDGVKAARFLDLVTQFLQQPLSLLRA